MSYRFLLATAISTVISVLLLLSTAGFVQESGLSGQLDQNNGVVKTIESADGTERLR